MQLHLVPWKSVFLFCSEPIVDRPGEEGRQTDKAGLEMILAGSLSQDLSPCPACPPSLAQPAPQPCPALKGLRTLLNGC